MAALPEFRENAERAIYLTGLIDEQLLHRLLPAINKLRALGDQPITAYVDSRGGLTYYAEQIRAALKAPNQEGNSCRLITVACSRAASAAADFLALGDYAICYPDAVVHCHGTRLPADEITSEKAESLAASLRSSNEGFALRLARRSFQRMAFHFANLRQEFPAIRRAAKSNHPSDPAPSDLECFAIGVHHHLSSGALKQLPREAFDHHELLQDMRKFVFEALAEENVEEPFAKTESRILNKLIEFELSRQELNTWTFSGGGLAEVVADFSSLIDYSSGPHRHEMANHIKAFGPLFLKARDLERYTERLRGDPNKAGKWLRTKVEPLIQPLWFFTVSMCRLLQTGEYSLTAVDAYWLGLVDEVIGQQLPTLRIIAEDQDVGSAQDAGHQIS